MEPTGHFALFTNGFARSALEVSVKLTRIDIEQTDHGPSPLKGEFVGSPGCRSLRDKPWEGAKKQESPEWDGLLVLCIGKPAREK